MKKQRKNAGVPRPKKVGSVSASKSSAKKRPGFPATPSRKKPKVSSRMIHRTIKVKGGKFWKGEATVPHVWVHDGEPKMTGEQFIASTVIGLKDDMRLVKDALVRLQNAPSTESLADAFERGRKERTEWYERHINETFVNGPGGTRWFNERLPEHMRGMYPRLCDAIVAYVEALERRAALGIVAKPTKEAVRRTGAKRSGAKPGPKATPTRKK